MTQEPTADPVGHSRPTIVDLIAQLAELPRPAEVEPHDIDPIPERPGL